MPRILIATLGSLGDVLPLIAVAKACRNRGFEVTFAANRSFGKTITSYDLQFAQLGAAKDAMTFSRSGADVAIPFIEQALDQLDHHFDVLLEFGAGADAIVAPYWVLPSHLVAQKLGIPFFACAFSPAYLLRGNDSGAEDKRRLKIPAHWHASLAALRRRVGLPRALLPYAEAFTAPAALLGLFPAFMHKGVIPGVERLIVCGYPRLQQRASIGQDEELNEFLDARTVTISFGSYADELDASYLFDESIAACRSLGLKCLYLSAFVARSAHSSPDVLVRAYVDHDVAFPRSGIIVHHAGMGTLIAACSHGKPMVCVPSAYDQPHNARQMQESIGTPSIPMASYSRHALRDALMRVTSEKEHSLARLNSLMKLERDGAATATDVLTRAMDR